MNMHALLYQEANTLVTHAPKQKERHSSAPPTSLVDFVFFARLAEQPRWRTRAESRFKEIQRLRRGWDGYQAAPVSPSVIEFARAVLDSVMTRHMPTPSVVPTHGGGLQLEWHAGGAVIELMIFRPCEAELSATFSDGREPVEELPLTTDFSALDRVLRDI